MTLCLLIQISCHMVCFHHWYSGVNIAFQAKTTTDLRCKTTDIILSAQILHLYHLIIVSLITSSASFLPEHFESFNVYPWRIFNFLSSKSFQLWYHLQFLVALLYNWLSNKVRPRQPHYLNTPGRALPQTSSTPHIFGRCAVVHTKLSSLSRNLCSSNSSLKPLH